MLSDGRREDPKNQNNKDEIRNAGHTPAEALGADKLPTSPKLTHGFELVSTEFIPDYASQASEYRHVKTGAKVFHLASADENKVFAIGFSTPAMNDMGAAHIVEHCVLAGSESFKVKDPFSVLARGSFQTFLNAFTASDQTIYPTASTNEAELLNLSKVYLDAVFKPLLTLDTFKREGWRLDVDEAKNGVNFSGVVFNEMKEASSSFNSSLFQGLFKGLFPDSCFAKEHGGAPSEIPKLSYEAFKNFHKDHYMPSNSTTVIYGNLSADNHLRMLDEYFSNFDSSRPELKFGSNTPIVSPKSAAASYPVEEDAAADKDNALVMAWALPVAPKELKYAPMLLNEILAGGPGSTLQSALDDAGISGVVSAKLDLGGPGHDTALILARGLAAADVTRAEAALVDALKDLAAARIPDRLIEKSAFGLGCSLASEAERSDRGIDIANEIISRSLSGLPPLFCSAPASGVDAFVQRAKTERLLETYLAQNLINNPSRLTLRMVPDPDAQARTLEAESALLKEMTKDLTPGQLKEIAAQNRAREAKDIEPDSAEDAASIPRVSLSDVAPQELRIKSEARGQAVFHELKSDSLVHASALFDLGFAGQKDLSQLPFLTEALLGLGTAREDHKARWNRLEGLVGDLDCGVITSTSRRSNDTRLFLALDAETTAATAKNIWPTFREIAFEANFNDSARLNKLLEQSLIQFETAVRKKPHAFAAMRVESALSDAGALSEALQGLSQLDFLRELSKSLKDNPAEVSRVLAGLRDAIFTRDGALMSIGASKESWPALELGASELLKALPAGLARTEDSFPSGTRSAKEMIIGANDTNHVYVAAKLPDTLNPAQCKMASEILTNLWVLPEIRLVGGAYGAGVDIDSRQTDGESKIVLSSYRDPNPLETIEKLLRAGDALRALNPTSMDLEDAAKSILSRLYYPLDQGDRAARGKLDFICPGRADGRDALRDEILKAERIDFSALADAVSAALLNPRIAIVASKQTAKKILKDDSWSVSRPLRQA